MGMGDFGEQQLNSARYIQAIVGARLTAAAFVNRKRMNENCLAGTPEKEAENVQLILEAYNTKKQRVVEICERKTAEARSCNAEDYCSGRLANFGRFAPSFVRDAALKANVNLDFSNASRDDIVERITDICKYMMNAEGEKQKGYMKKEFERKLKDIKSMCERERKMEEEREKWDEQRRQQEEQWRNQGQQGGWQGGPGQPGGQYSGQPQGPPPDNCPNGWHIEGRKINGQYVQEYVCNEGSSGGGQQGPPQGGCPPDQYWDAGRNMCVLAGGGGGGQQGPVCGDRVCNEDPNTCQQDCGQQGGGGGGQGTVCGNGSCEAGETRESCAPDCGGGGLAANVFNRMLGNPLYSFTALINLLRLQEGGYGPPQGGGFGGTGPINCPVGEYPGMNDQGQYSCIRPNSGQGPSGGSSEGLGMGPPIGFGGPGGGPGYGPGVGGFGREVCDKTDEELLVMMEEQMGGPDMGEIAETECTREAEMRADELTMELERAEAEVEVCIARREALCAFKQDAAEYCREVVDNVEPLVTDFVKFRCQMVRAAGDKLKASRLASVGLGLYELSQELGGNFSTVGETAANDVVANEEVIKKKKQEGGFFGVITGNADLGNTYQATAEELGKKEELIQELRKQKLDEEKTKKLEEIGKKIKEAKENYTTKAANEKAGILGVLGRILPPPD